MYVPIVAPHRAHSLIRIPRTPQNHFPFSWYYPKPHHVRTIWLSSCFASDISTEISPSTLYIYLLTWISRAPQNHSPSSWYHLKPRYVRPTRFSSCFASDVLTENSQSMLCVYLLIWISRAPQNHPPSSWYHLKPHHVCTTHLSSRENYYLFRPEPLSICRRQRLER